MNMDEFFIKMKPLEGAATYTKIRLSLHRAPDVILCFSLNKNTKMIPYIELITLLLDRGYILYFKKG